MAPRNGVRRGVWGKVAKIATFCVITPPRRFGPNPVLDHDFGPMENYSNPRISVSASRARIALTGASGAPKFGAGGALFWAFFVFLAISMAGTTTGPAPPPAEPHREPADSLPPELLVAGALVRESSPVPFDQ